MNFFNEVRLRTGADFVVTAHHLDDEIETFLFRLITGRTVASEEGLIREIDNDRKVIRPFLSVSRDQISVYAEQNSVPFVEDCTNMDTAYSRNFIRHKILPLFEELNPSARRSLDEYIRKSSSEEHFLEQAALTLLSDENVQLKDIPEVLKIRVLRHLAIRDIGAIATCISNRRYQVLSEMLLMRPREKKRIDMGLKVTAVIDPGCKEVMLVKFIKK